MKFYGGTVTGSLTVNGTQTINGTLTAQTLVVQTITSSISRITGSTQFGSSSINTHQFTGSLLVSGSISSISTITGSAILVNPTGPGFITIGNSGSYGSISSGGGGVTLYMNGSVRGGASTAASNAAVLATDGNIYFSDSTTNTHKMFISGSGRVGIGTTNFNFNYGLVIANQSTDGSYIGLTNQTGVTGDRVLRIGFASGSTVATIQGTRFSTADDINIALQAGGGNVGIGTTSPSYKLSVANEMIVGAQGGTDFLYMSGGSGFGSKLRTYYSGGSINNELSGNSNTLLNLVAGNVGVVTSDPKATLHVAGSTATLRVGPWFSSNDRDFIELQADGTNTKILSPNETFSILNPASGNIDIISSTGGVRLTGGATSWSAISDVRKKKNFESSPGLAKIMQVEPVKYHFEWDTDEQPKRIGFLAQNLQPLIPEMVNETKEKAPDGSSYLTITPDYMLPVLVKAIQEQQAQITALQAEVETLKNK